MEYVLTDTSRSFFFDFKVGEELVVPDTGSVKITLSKLDNVPIVGYNQKVITPTSEESNVLLTIDSTVNGKTADFEMRQLLIEFDFESKPLTEYINYRIVDRVNIPVTLDEVRASLGVNESECPNEFFDIIASFYSVEADLNGVDLDAALQTGAASVGDYLSAIKYRSALDVLPALQLAVNQSEQADNVVYRRFIEVDFNKLRVDIEDKYSNSLNSAAAASSTSLNYMVVTADTDPVIGA